MHCCPAPVYVLIDDMGILYRGGAASPGISQF
jgi:hypothetical protein